MIWKVLNCGNLFSERTLIPPERGSPDPQHVRQSEGAAGRETRAPLCSVLVLLAVSIASLFFAVPWGTARVAAAEPQTAGFSFDDFLLAPLRVHFLSSPEAPQLSTTLTASDFTRILGKMNRVWAQAGIQFYLESLVKEEPQNADQFPHPEAAAGFRWMLQLRPKDSQASNMFHLYYVKQMRGNGVYLGDAIFVKDTASLKPVPDGIDEPIPRVSSHEIGHALNLDHRQNVTNLMASGTTGTWLDDEEIRRAREAAKHFQWIESASTVMKKAEELERTKKTEEAKEWYRRLAALPLKSEEVERAKKLASE